MKLIQELHQAGEISCYIGVIRTVRQRSFALPYAVHRDADDEIANSEGFVRKVHHIIKNVPMNAVYYSATRPNGSTNTSGFEGCFRLSAHRIGHTEHDSYRAVHRRDVCRNGQLKHGQHSKRQSSINTGRADSPNYIAKKIRKLIVKLAKVKWR